MAYVDIYIYIYIARVFLYHLSKRLAGGVSTFFLERTVPSLAFSFRVKPFSTTTVLTNVSEIACLEMQFGVVLLEYVLCTKN